MSGRKSDLKAAWNEYNEARALRERFARNPDPACIGYDGPPVVALMGYRGPYVPSVPVAKPASAPVRRKVGRPSRAIKEEKDARLAREVAMEFDAYGFA